MPQLLRPCAVDASAVEVHLERDVMSALARHRAQALGAASTAWDLSLGHMLMPALEAYEHVRRCGLGKHCGSWGPP